MCGIFAVYGKVKRSQIANYNRQSNKQKHRGPDQRGIKTLCLGNPDELDYFECILAHERLSIIDLHTGRQPLVGCTQHAYVVHNGEIYNHTQLTEHLHAQGHTVTSTCDSEVIVHLIEDALKQHKQNGTDLTQLLQEVCLKLDGVFAFACWVDGQMVVARDPIGVKPLYMGKNNHGDYMFASEMKCLIDDCQDTELVAFPPGQLWTPQTGLIQYFKPTWFDHVNCQEELDLAKVRRSLIDATVKRLMADVPLGVLLSGGLDSSLTSAIACREFNNDQRNISSFSIGLDANAPDLIAARKVADFLGTDHHEVYFTVEEGIQAIENLVWHLESYDVTTIRASTPMYLLTKYIREQGIKVLLSGEGADEILGGYLYFHQAPNDEEFQKETISRVQKLSTADCLRADKSTMAHSLEVRVPFLDKQFLQTCMSIAATHKRPIRGTRPEKAILRQAFDDSANPWLPHDVLWRQKEQFSDGVGYNWIDTIKDWCEKQVSDADMRTAEKLYPINPPQTKEAFYIRQVFSKYYPGEQAAKTVKCWTPKWQKSQDPSGRACSAHEQSTDASLHTSAQG